MRGIDGSNIALVLIIFAMPVTLEILMYFFSLFKLNMLFMTVTTLTNIMASALEYTQGSDESEYATQDCIYFSTETTVSLLYYFN